MKRVLSISAFLLSIAPIALVAGSLEETTVIEVRANKNNIGIVKFESNLDNFATCSSPQYRNSLIIDLNTHGGRTMESIALAALASGKKVTVVGTGGCVLDPDTIEDASSIHIKK